MAFLIDNRKLGSTIREKPHASRCYKTIQVAPKLLIGSAIIVLFAVVVPIESGLESEPQHSEPLLTCQPEQQSSTNRSSLFQSSDDLLSAQTDNVYCSDSFAAASNNSNQLEDDDDDEQRLPLNWNYDYIEERFSTKIKDVSADQKLANIMHTSYIARLFYYFVYKFDSPIAGLENSQLEQLAAGPKVNDTLCGEHLSEFMAQRQEMNDILVARRAGNGSQIFQEKHLRLAGVLDSFGRYEAGLLMGRTHSLGSYNQCKESQLLLNGQLVGGRYCMANLDVSKHQEMGLKLARVNLTAPVEDFFSIAICLPESCHTRNFVQNKELFETLIASEFQLPASIYQEQHLRLESIFCELDPDSPLMRVPLSGQLFLIFSIIWIGAVLYSTYQVNLVHGHQQQPQQQKDQTTTTTTAPIGDKLMQCLDLKSSWDEFTCANERNLAAGSKQRVSLNALNPIKVCGCLLVVMGHALISNSGAAMDAIRTAREMQTDSRSLFITGGTVIVDTFYVITGIIISYISMKRFNASRLAKEIIEQREQVKSDDETNSTVEGNGKFLEQCLGLISKRYLRLVPLYFIVFWFKKSLMTTLSSGPFWDHGYNRETEAGACREESWLTPFTSQAAYLPLSKQCMPQAWSVAGDIFFALIMGPIIVLMTQRPVLTGLISVAICIVSNLSMLMAVLQINPSMAADLLDLKYVALSEFFKTGSYIYTAPHVRVFSTLVGVLAGYVLYHYNEATDDSHRLRKWPDWLRKFATKAAIWYIVLSLTMSPLIPTLKSIDLIRQFNIHRILTIHLLSTHRLFWALSNATVFLRMVTDWKDSYWMQNNAGKFWATMTKLNFAILLVHVDVLKFDGYMMLGTYYYSFYGIFRSFLLAYMLSLPIALILYVLFENPIDRLVKYAIGK